MIRTCFVFTVLLSVILLTIEKPGVVLALCNASYSASGASNCHCESDLNDDCTGTSVLAITTYLQNTSGCRVEFQTNWYCPHGDAPYQEFDAQVHTNQGGGDSVVIKCGALGNSSCSGPVFSTSGVSRELTMFYCTDFTLVLRLNDACNESPSTCNAQTHLKWIAVNCEE